MSDKLTAVAELPVIRAVRPDAEIQVEALDDEFENEDNDDVTEE